MWFDVSRRYSTSAMSNLEDGPASGPFVMAGAYELPKAVKEHETLFHDNPNYITTFEI